MGKHDELKKKRGLYYELIKKQKWRRGRGKTDFRFLVILFFVFVFKLRSKKYTKICKCSFPVPFNFLPFRTGYFVWKYFEINAIYHVCLLLNVLKNDSEMYQTNPDE